MKDCRECKHATKSYNQWLCTAMNLPRPTSFMRDARSECGLEGALWEEKKEKRYAEYDE